MMDDNTKRIFYSSCAMILISKGLTVASPLFLKEVIDMMSLGTNINSTSILLGIGGFGLTRLLGTCTHEYRMYQIAQIIQAGLRRVNSQAFKHMHSLDINFHKAGSKNTVFAINRAMSAIESAMRFSLGIAAPVLLEFALLCGVIHYNFGAFYLGNMLATLGLYTLFTKNFAEMRRIQIRDRKNAHKNVEFRLNESIMNYETVKTFNSEKFEETRF